MTVPRIIYIDNDNDVLWRGMIRDATGEFINDATVTMSLFAPGDDPDTDDPITGADDVVMTYQTGSNGDYLGVLPNSLTLTAGTGYKLRVTATGTYHGQRTLDVTALERTT